MAKQGRKASNSTRSWDSAPIAPWIQSAMLSTGFKQMTPVQAACIPLFVGHKDVVVEAVTGSGKTLAFAIPIIQRLLSQSDRTKKNHIASIVLCPTTELARQIQGVFLSILKCHPPSVAALKKKDDTDDEAEADSETTERFSPNTPVVVAQLIVAGKTNPTQDLAYFLEHSSNVLIATPGRLLQLLASPHVKCVASTFEVLVLDEADRLLDLGFKDDLQRIVNFLPKQRRTGLFSATVSEALEDIIRIGLRNPVKIAVKVRGAAGEDEKSSPASLRISHIVLPASQRFPWIKQLLMTLNPQPLRTIMYFSTCAAVEYFQLVLHAVLTEIGSSTFTLISLHGKQIQKVRQKNFHLFSHFLSPIILLTTDVAARGLDIPQVDLVLQMDPPNDPKTFLHRCGRAGRAGRRGTSIVFLLPGREEDYIRFLEVRKTPLSLYELAGSFEDTAKEMSNAMRAIVRQDRSLHDKAQRGFVSWVKAYSKHQASSIFRVADLDWADLGLAWGLLKLPKMPELRKWNGDSTLGLTVDFDQFAYKDRAQEEARLKERETYQLTKRKRKETSRPWSKKLDLKDDRELRREKRQKKSDLVKWEHMNEEERAKHLELKGMIEKVREQHRAEAAGDTFEGFA